LLETLRQYGQQRLRDHQEDEVLRHRHYTYYQELVAHATADLFSARELIWMDRLQQELPNIHAALDYCLTQPILSRPELDMATSMAMIRFTLFSAIPGQCRHWMDRLLAQSPKTPSEFRVAAIAHNAFVAACQGDSRVATALLAECRELASHLHHGDKIPELLFLEGSYALIALGDPAAIPILARAREEFRNRDAVADQHMTTMLWSMAAALLGDAETAFTASSACLAEAEERHAAWAYSWAMWCVGLAELKHGDPHNAVAQFRESLRRQRGMGDYWGPCWGLEALGWATATTGDHEYAAQLMGAAHKLRQTIGVTLDGMGPYHESHTQAEDLIRRAIDDHAYTAAFDLGFHTNDPIGLALDR